MNKPKPIFTMTPVKSSQVESHGYDAATRTLAGGSEYHYHDVSPETHHAMSKAESVGKFINASIKPNFKFKKVGS